MAAAPLNQAQLSAAIAAYNSGNGGGSSAATPLPPPTTAPNSTTTSMYDTPVGVGGKINNATGQILSGPMSGQQAGTDQTTTYSPTVVTDSNIRENTIPKIQQQVTKYVPPAYSTPTAPPGSPAASTTQTGTTPTTSSTTGGSQTTATDTSTPANEYDAYLKSIFDDNPSSGTTGAASPDDPYLGILKQMQATSDAATQSMIAATTKTFDARKAQLDATQQAEHAGLMQALTSNGESRYAPLLAGSRLTADETSHILALSSIDAEEGAAVAQLQKAQSDQDYQTMGKYLDHLDSLRTDKINIASKLADSAAAATKAINDAKQKVIDDKNQIAGEAAKNGATPDQLAAIMAAPDMSGAITAAGPLLQDPTTPAGQYNAYVKATLAKGLTPLSAGDFLANQKSKEAYNSAYSTAAGKAAADAKFGNSDAAVSSTTPDPSATGITGATGLSLQAFNYLTQGTASMSRLSAAQRNAITKEAGDFLNKNGLDVSTFKSQYDAYNDVLQHNLERANNTKVFAGEITGTVDQFASDIGSDFGKLKIGNVAKLLAGGEVNDPTTQKYAFDLQTMQNDLAGYYAASRTGAANATPDDSDKRAAAEVIKNGINAGSAAAFKQSIVDNEKKVTGVVNSAASDAQKQVWDLFGVGSQFKAKEPQVNPKTAVDTYVKANNTTTIGGKKLPDFVADMYLQPGATDENVYAWLSKNGYIK